MNGLLILLTILVTLTPKKKTEPWASCNMNVCVVENPTKKPVRFYFSCGEKYEDFSVVVPPKTQDQVVVNDEKAFCSLDRWK